MTMQRTGMLQNRPFALDSVVLLPASGVRKVFGPMRIKVSRLRWGLVACSPKKPLPLVAIGACSLQEESGL